jgi:peptidoglycan hydrolase-like protein with peptidoglycan-binding domain
MSAFQPSPYSGLALRNPATLSLKRGSKGKDVELLQELLLEAGDEFGLQSRKRGLRTEYYTAWEPGVFDEVTHDSVMAFQSAKGLGVDGIVGKNTWKALGVSASDSSSGGAVQKAQDFVADKVLDLKGDPEEPFYKQPWFIPVAVSASVLVIGTAVILLKD